MSRKPAGPPALQSDFGGNDAVIAAFTRFTDMRVIRYGLASVGALAADMGSFMALLAFGVPAAGASALGYSLGIGVHWWRSSRAVFADSVAARGPDRTRQKALFVASALLGLAITTATVGLADFGGIDPLPAKLAAIGISFTVTWLLRSRVVFRPEPAAP